MFSPPIELARHTAKMAASTSMPVLYIAPLPLKRMQEAIVKACIKGSLILIGKNKAGIKITDRDFTKDPNLGCSFIVNNIDPYPAPSDAELKRHVLQALEVVKKDAQGETEEGEKEETGQQGEKDDINFVETIDVTLWKGFYFP